jgi:hypothetical protein
MKNVKNYGYLIHLGVFPINKQCLLIYRWVWVCGLSRNLELY